MLKLSWVAVALVVLGASGCSSPTKTYKGAGSFQQENYEIDIQADRNGSRKLTVLLNGETAFTADRTLNMNNDSGCEQLSLYVWNCSYLANYRGMKISVLELFSAKPLDQYVQYDVYLENQLLQRIRGSV
jgi:hypothetical protein